MRKEDKNTVVLACFLIAITIGLGAFGAHGLKELVSEASLTTFETGVRYQMYHAIGILILGLADSIPSQRKKWTIRLFLVGIIFFSGSLYLLSLQTAWGTDLSFLGPVTPVGGLLLILGWVLLAIRLLTMSRDNSLG